MSFSLLSDDRPFATDPERFHIDTRGNVHITLHLGPGAPTAPLEPREPAPAPAGNMHSGRLVRYFMLGLLVAGSVAAGYALGSGGPAGSAQFADVAPSRELWRQVPLTPTPVPTAPLPSLQPKGPSSARDAAVRRDALPPGDVPSAVTRQLAQPPVITPAPAPNRPAASGSAFGLEN